MAPKSISLLAESSAIVAITVMEEWGLVLSSSLRGKLISAGYTSPSLISSVSSSDLARGEFLLYKFTQKISLLSI